MLPISIGLLTLARYSCNRPGEDLKTAGYESYFKRIDTLPHQAVKDLLDSLNVLFKQLPPGVQDRATYYKTRANYELNVSNFDAVFLQLDSLKKLLERNKTLPVYTQYFSEMLLTKSDAYTKMTRYDEGINSLLEAKEFIEQQVRDSCTSVAYKRRIADMLYEQKRFKLAAQHYLETHKQSELCKNNSFDGFYQGQSTLANTALSYADALVNDSAEYYYHQAIQYIQLNGPKFPEHAAYAALAEAVVKGNLAVLKSAQSEFEEAEKLFLYSIQGTSEQYPGFANGARLNLAGMYINWNKPAEAELLLNVLDTIRNGTVKKTPRSFMAWSRNQKLLWEKKGDMARAMQFNNKYLQIRDSLDNLNRKNIDRDLGLEIIAKEQKATNISLQKQNHAKSFQLLIALLLIVIALVITCVVWYYSRKTSRYAKKLKLLNREIEEKKDDLKAAYISLESSYNSNTMLMRTVAHDLKNPIGGIRNLVHVLQKKEEKPEIKEVLDIISTACSNSISLINDLVKKETAINETMPKEINDIYRLLAYCVSLMEPRAQEKKQKLKMKGLSIVLPFNRERMWRVISNILNNAIQFSPENATIDVKLEHFEDSALLSVKDQGIGIPEDLAEKIFSMHPDARREGTYGEESNGIGLIISKKIVEEHGGRLWFESNKDEGSTFFILLPGKS